MTKMDFLVILLYFHHHHTVALRNTKELHKRCNVAYSLEGQFRTSGAVEVLQGKGFPETPSVA